MQHQIALLSQPASTELLYILRRHSDDVYYRCSWVHCPIMQHQEWVSILWNGLPCHFKDCNSIKILLKTHLFNDAYNYEFLLYVCFSNPFYCFQRALDLATRYTFLMFMIFLHLMTMLLWHGSMAKWLGLIVIVFLNQTKVRG